MARRRAAGLLLALAACVATTAAAPTSSNHTALDLYDGAPEGCYYNFQHYGEGDRIMTNEPCLNCTCHNRMLMCYLRVCPFTKPIGQDCTVEKRADQCCPIVTCPDVPVDLLTSTTTSPAEYGPTGVGKLDKFGCSINGKYFSEGSKVPPTPNKPCEHCYCIRNMTTCVMQECTLHVDGCTPIYHKDVCCPVRYSCDHPEDEMPLLDDLSTTVRPTPGFLLTTTTISPVTQMSQDCVYDNRIFPDGALIKTEKACDHCYCMKGDIVCVVQECGTPMENEGKNCTALSPREGVCCPDTYICEGDETSSAPYETDELTTQAVQEKLTTLSPPRRTSSEGSGYRNEPDEVSNTEPSLLEPEVEGSGDNEEPKQPDEVTTGKPKPESTDDILASTEETHEFIPLTTTTPKKEEESITDASTEGESLISSSDIEKTTEPQEHLSSTTDFYSTKDFEEPTTDGAEDIGSGELPEDMSLKPQEEVHPVSPILPDKEGNIVTTEMYEENVKTTFYAEQKSPEQQTPVTSTPYSKEKDKPTEQDVNIHDIGDLTTSVETAEHDVTAATISAFEEVTKTPELTESSILEEITRKVPELFDTTTTSIVEKEVEETTSKSIEESAATREPDFTKDSNLENQYLSSTSAPLLEDDLVTTETQELATDRTKETEFFEPQHVTASTPMLEEIEKDTTEFMEPEQVISIGAIDNTFNIPSTTLSNIPVIDNEKEVIETHITDEHIPGDDLLGTTINPVYDYKEQSTSGYTNIKESTEPEQLSSSTTASSSVDDEMKTTLNAVISNSEDDSDRDEPGLGTSDLESVTEESTTEPDKGLNTIPNEIIEEEMPLSPEEQTSATTEQNAASQGDLTDRFSTETEDVIGSTISDTSLLKEEQSTTESAFRKEDYSPTESQITQKITTVTASVTEVVTSTLTLDHTKSAESTLEEHHKDDTIVPTFTESIEETTLAKEISDIPKYEYSTSAVAVSETITEKSTTVIPIYEKETTTINQEDNEIFNEPRIPGEGDCLLNGLTYTNESAVPSTNKCQSGCKCISSIIKCDPIICSPPPEYMDNCETLYDTPNACCPTYICDHKSETIPPQSHSQMSGTETPAISPALCHGDECEISKDQKHHDESSYDCKEGNCAGSSDEFKETTGYPQNIPENPLIVQNEECVGDECKKVLCADKDGCQSPSLPPCAGDKCETLPESVLPPETLQCANGEDCGPSNIPSKDCVGSDCDSPSTQKEDTQSTQLCSGKEGCLNVPQLLEDECKEDNCRRKDSSPLDQDIGACKTSDCKPSQTDVATPAVSVPEQAQSSSNQTEFDNDIGKDITEPTEVLESVTKFPEHGHSTETSEFTESHEIENKQPEDNQDESSVTSITESTSKLKPELATNTAEYIEGQGTTSSEFVTERKDFLFTKSPENQLPVVTETIKENSEKDTSQSLTDIEKEITEIPATQKNDIGAEHPELYTTTEKSTSPGTFDVHVSTAVYSSESQEPTEQTKMPGPEDETNILSEESSTEASILSTMEAHEMVKPVVDAKEDISKDVVTDSKTELPTFQDDMKKPDISDNADTTIQESSTDPSRISTTESDEASLQETKPSKSTSSFDDNKFTHGTEPAMIEINEPTESASEPTKYDVTTVSAITNDLQGTTISKSPEDNDISSDINEVTASEPYKPNIIDESSQSTTRSDSSNEESTTKTILEGISTEPSSLYLTEKENEVTSSQEKEGTTVEEYVNVTVPPKVQTQSNTIYSEEVNHDVTTIPDTEITQTATEPRVPENVFDKEITEESSAKPDSEKSDHKDLVPSIVEVSSESSVTDVTPKEVDQSTTISEITDEQSTKPINVYPIEQQEDSKPPIEIKPESTTYKTLSESNTEPPKYLDTDISKRPEEDTEPKVSEATEEPILYTTKAQDIITESDEEPPKDGIKHEIITIEPITEEPYVETDIPELTVSEEFLTSKPDELTTEVPISDSKIITTPQKDSSEETTDTIIHDFETKPLQTEESDKTGSSVKEQVGSTPTQTDISITTTSLPSESDLIKHAETTPKSVKQDTQELDIESQTITTSPTSSEGVTQSDIDETKHSQRPPVTEKEITQPIDAIVSVPAFIPTETDELRTTPADVMDVTTSKTIEISQLPHSQEIQTEYPETTYTSISQETSTERLSTSTEKLIIPETSTDKPSAATNADKTELIESGTESSQAGTESEILIPESSTEEQINKHTSPDLSVEHDSTKIYPDEGAARPEYHDSKESEKPVDGLINSPVTELYESGTKPSDFERETQVPPQMASKVPEVEQDYISDKLSTPPSIELTDTTSKEVKENVVTSTEYDKPVEQDIPSEYPAYVDKIGGETTTQKTSLLQDGDVIQESTGPEQVEVITSTTTVHKSTTDRSDTPMIAGTAETFTELQELAPSTPSVDVHDITIGTSYTTESPEKHREPALDITKVPDVETETETPKVVSTESPESLPGKEMSKPISEEHDLTSEEQKTTLEPGKEKLDVTTLSPSSSNEMLSPISTTLEPKQEYPEVPSTPPEEIEHKDITQKEITKISVAGDLTTESELLERNTEKQPDNLQTISPETATPVEEFLSTKTQPKPEIYHTTAHDMDTIIEISTRPSTSYQEGLTTLTQGFEEKLTTAQSIPDMISDLEKTSTPQESIAVQTEKATTASEKPMQIVTSPEEEFIVATSKSTTEKEEQEKSTLSPDRITKPSDTTAESYSTVSPDSFVTVASDGPVYVVTEEHVTIVPDSFITSAPDALITKPHDVSVTIEAEDSDTKLSEAPVTYMPEIMATKAPDAPITRAPEEPVTNASEIPIISASEEYEEPTTNAPEVPITTTSEVPKEHITNVPEAPITNTPEAPEEPITNTPEILISSAPETLEGLITNAPEAPITSASETPERIVTDAPEAPITSAPEASEEPSTNVPEASVTSASESPEGLVTNAPEAPIISTSEATEDLITNAPKAPITSASEAPEEHITNAPEAQITSSPKTPEGSIVNIPEDPITNEPDVPESPNLSVPEAPITDTFKEPATSTPESPEGAISSEPETPIAKAPEAAITIAPEVSTLMSSLPEVPITHEPEVPTTITPEAHVTKASETPISSASEEPTTRAPEPSVSNEPELPATSAPELPKPVSTEVQPTDEALTPDEEASFPPSGGTSGYGQEPDYVEEDQTFGPGTCRYGGKVYVSAQQIPRDDPCDFCFCFRSDIICLQQSCPPPIHGCHEEPIQGFCCPRYECPVSMATTVNVTTTTTTTTTTLPPHFPTHSYKGSVQKRGCQIKGQTYKVGEVVRASSGPCLHCTCGGDGQMKCDPKVCTPEPMLRQMIAAAVSAKRRR